MAREVIYRLVDDLTGEPIPEGLGESVIFSYQGTDYEVDLSDENAKSFHEALEKYARAGRKASGRAKRSGSRTSTVRSELAAVRSWAQENGYVVNSRGRIAQPIMEAYAAAKGRS